MTETGLDMKRPCLAVADLPRALSIYQDILGFRLDYESEASPTSYLYPVFKLPPEAKLKFAALSTEYEPRALTLTEVKGIPLPPPTVPHRAAIVLRVPEVATVIQKLSQLGLEIIAPNTFDAPPNLKLKEQAFWDYDRHLIVLYEVKTTS